MVVGPHTFNFAEATELACEAGAAWRTPGLPAAADKALALVQHPHDLEKARAAATAFAQAHRVLRAPQARQVADLLGVAA